jgi:hypothetical protein
MGGRAAGEDIQNQRGSVDDHDVEGAFEVALLGRGEIVVDHDHVVRDVGAPLLDLFQLALADVGAGERVGESLRDRPDDLDVDGFGEAGQLFQRVGGRPGLTRPLDGDQERMLGGAVGGEWCAWNGESPWWMRITTDCIV